MRTISCILMLVTAAAACDVFAAESSAFVLHKNADGTHEFMMNVSPEKSADSKISSAPISQDSGTNASYLRTAGFLLVIAGIGMLLVWRHKKNITASPSDARKMTVIERLALGARRELILVRACDRMLVIGSQGNQMMLISDLAIDPDPVATEFNTHVTAKPSEPATPPAPVVDQEELKSVLIRSLKVPGHQKVADTVAISREAKEVKKTKRRDWPEMQEAS